MHPSVYRKLSSFRGRVRRATLPKFINIIEIFGKDICPRIVLSLSLRMSITKRMFRARAPCHLSRMRGVHPSNLRS